MIREGELEGRLSGVKVARGRLRFLTFLLRMIVLFLQRRLVNRAVKLFIFPRFMELHPDNR